MKATTLRQLRTLHLYVGMFFAPAILFFAISGGLQTFRLQQASGWDGAPPPQWMATMGSVHIDQRLPEAEAKKPEVEKPKPPMDPAKAAARKAKAAKALPVKIFTAALAIALSLSTLLGIGIALGTKSTRRVALIMLAAGAVVPVLLLA